MAPVGSSDVALRRRSVRGVILTPQGQLLLQQGHDPTLPSVPPYWFLPGGGIEPGEDDVQALRRELLEECGLRDVEVGWPLWEQRATFRFAGVDFDQDEQVFLVRVPSALAVEPTALEALEASAFLSTRWWLLAELGTTIDVVYPLDLVDRLGAAGLPVGA